MITISLLSKPMNGLGNQATRLSWLISAVLRVHQNGIRMRPGGFELGLQVSELRNGGRVECIQHLLL